jgi:hypothetical protein
MNLIKQSVYFLTGFVLLEIIFFPAIAKANDRDITDQEREKIVQTLKSIDCNAFGEADYEIDQQRFEIDNVVCANGQKYEIYLDQNYRIIKKELEN